MPRETIKGEQHPTSDFSVEVGWHREAEYVQIATSNFDATKHNPADYKSFYADLDRAAINKLIVVLRRARDQAFGRDE
jgi:hypothetical protein